jgi:energy-coupling factor transporter ATP-binding protein EcfA2
MTEADIRGLLHNNSQQIMLDGYGNTSPNALALNDVLEYISTNTGRHTKTSMKSLLDRFTRSPYGFIEADVQWLVTKLFRTGDISFYVNSEPVTLLSKPENEIFRFVTRREFNERLMMERRDKVPEKQKKSVREVMKELFGASAASDDDDAIMKSFLTYAGAFKTKLEQYDIHYRNQPKYPGRKVIKDGLSLLQKVLDLRFTNEFFKTVDGLRDDFFDLTEDYEPVRAFFDGEQQGTVTFRGELLSDMPLFRIAQSFGTVFQNPRTQFYTVNTTSEIAFGLENMGTPREQIRKRVEQTAKELETLNGKPYPVVQVVGGGSQAEYLNQLTADALGKTVYAGPTEASAIGNIIVQMWGRGGIGSLDEARQIVGASFPVKVFQPRS